jgi:hypothetical protein
VTAHLGVEAEFNVECNQKGHISGWESEGQENIVNGMGIIGKLNGPKNWRKIEQKFTCGFGASLGK